MRFIALSLLLAIAGCASVAGHPRTDARWLLDGGALSVATPAALPAGRPFRVAVYGDAQGHREVQRAVVAAIREQKPDLVVFVGDACECLPAGHMPDLGTATYLVPFWPQFQRGQPAFGLLSLLPFPALWHESVLRPLGPPRDPTGFNTFLEESWPLRGIDRVPFLFVPGNHDLYHLQDRKDVARFTGARDGEPPWHATDIGPLRFIVLDAGTDLPGDPELLDAKGDQLKWLDKSLADARDKRMVPVVCIHFPPYSSAAVEPPSAQVRYNVAEQVLAKRGVRLVLSGHEHAYERIEVAPGGNAMTCIVTGGAGGKFTTLEPSRKETGSKCFVEGLHHFVMLEVSEHEIRGKMIPLDPGATFVPGWHEKRDEFVVPLK
ncbi:MAG: metallophosphoesterase [Planctomycetes bacterium]|nr:metallophosphoesterase [Planctomycetota bacterium]